MAGKKASIPSSMAQAGSSSVRDIRVALYCRVSTNTGQQSPEMQVRELQEYAERRGWRIVDEYTDQGISGAKESRPALNRLVTEAHRRCFDAVLVWKLDRFGRSLRHLVNALAEFEALGIAFVSLRDNLDLSTPSGRLMFQIIGAMAEFERTLIAERVKAGMRNARAKGRKIGRPPRTFLPLDMRSAIAEAYERKEGSLRQLAARFETSVGSIQRCIAANG
ncbi:MAG TPA: recombinase family protein [Terriglobia bacterium]|nr:recombinase family protein [Terriglobia bacterium]